MSFANLKRNRTDIASLTAAAEAVGGTQKQSYVDDRFWKPTVDKAGNGYAVIRFLPAPAGEDLPWVRYWDHGFKGPTGVGGSQTPSFVQICVDIWNSVPLSYSAWFISMVKVH